MAALTDEEKAALIGGTDAKNAEDLNAEEGSQTETAETTAEDETEGTTETEAASGAEEQRTLEKRFPNLKGDSWDTYGTELETAYQNSFTEALRLKKELDEARAVLANLPTVKDAGEDKPVPPQSPAGYDQLPEIQYVRTVQQRDMKVAFDTFSESYPQVREEANFAAFRNAATPIGNAFMATEGREPTYDELFPKIASYLGWESTAAEGQRGQGLKETLGQSGGGGGQTNPPARRAKVTNAQVDAYLKMFPNMPRGDAITQLEAAIS